MNYAGFVTDLSTWTEIASTNADFIAALPTIIELAEKRCYRELDLVDASVTDVLGTLTTASGRDFVFPTTYGRFIAVDQLGVILPISGTLVPMTPASVAFIDQLYPSATELATTDLPMYFARINDTSALIGPVLGSSYGTVNVQTRGTVRPTALSAGNTTTWLTLYAYDLFFSACMVAASAYMRNFGAQADNPQMAISWESQYQARLLTAQQEELRKKFIYVGTERD